jgi:hypothetical protein
VPSKPPPNPFKSFNFPECPLESKFIRRITEVGEIEDYLGGPAPSGPILSVSRGIEEGTFKQLSCGRKREGVNSKYLRNPFSRTFPM